MIADKLRQFDKILQEQHPLCYQSLYPGIVTTLSDNHPCKEWFTWKNGQDRCDNDHCFGIYRFVPLAEAQDAPRQLRTGNPLATLLLLVLSPKLLVAWPLLEDGAGDGYYFNALTNRVFWKMEGTPDRSFSSFEAFIDFLIEVAAISEKDILKRAESEISLLQVYTK